MTSSGEREKRPTWCSWSMRRKCLFSWGDPGVGTSVSCWWLLRWNLGGELATRGLFLICWLVVKCEWVVEISEASQQNKFKLSVLFCFLIEVPSVLLFYCSIQTIVIKIYAKRFFWPGPWNTTDDDICNNWWVMTVESPL